MTVMLRDLVMVVWMKYLLTHDSDAERFSDWLSGLKYLLTHDSDAERFSDWLSG